MILKFDHISYSCSYSDEKKIMDTFKKYQVIIKEEHIENLKAKDIFLQNKQQYHNITLLEKQGKIPIEVTSYERCNGAGNYLDINEDVISILTNNIDASVKLFQDMKFKIVNSTTHEFNAIFYSILNKSELKVKLIKTDVKEDWYLDKLGYTSLAFIVDNINKEKNRFELLNYVTTDIESIYINGKMLNIFFLRGKAGEIIEFIGLK